MAGFFATVSDSKPAQDLMRDVAAAVRKSFIRVKAFWVGPEALVALRNGTRLTTAIQIANRIRSSGVILDARVAHPFACC